MAKEEQKQKVKYVNWICRKCGQEVIASAYQPSPIRWIDGHVCYFTINEEEKKND